MAQPTQDTAVSPEEQQKTYDKLAALNRLSQVEKDEAGNILAVGFSNHPSLAEENEAEGAKPGLSDEDVQSLLKLPFLEVVALQSQKLTDSGYQHLGRIPRIEAVTISDPVYTPGLSHAYVMSLDKANEQLVVLDLEQSQAIDASALPLLWGFPKLRFLGVDRVSADASLIDFTEGAPLIEWLDLRQTTLTDEQFGRVIRNLPNLKMLQITVAEDQDPETGLGPHSLRHLKEHPKLNTLVIEDPAFLPLTWENGLEAVSTIPTLDQFFYLDRGVDPDKQVAEEDIARLKENRPMNINGPNIALPDIQGLYWRVGIL